MAANEQKTVLASWDGTVSSQPLRFHAVLLIGCLLSLIWPVEQGLWLASIVVTGLALSLHVKCAGVVLSGLAMGAYAALVAAGVLSKWPSTNERLAVQGQIISVPQWQRGRWRFDASIRFPRHPERTALQLRMSAPAAADRPRAGETWQWLIRLRAVPRGEEFGSMRRALLRDRLHGTADVMASKYNRRLQEAPTSLLRLREHITVRMSEVTADRSSAALLPALAVGATGAVSSRQWQVFSATGITHLIAISGLHVTFLAILVMALARRLWVMSVKLAQHCPRERFAAVCGSASALAYALLSGFSVPAQRTVVMLVLMLVWREFGRRIAPLQALAWSSTLLLVWDPLAVLSAGFWLSFAAVAVLLIYESSKLGSLSSWRAGLAAQGAISIALIPMTQVLFGSFSWASPLANALAIPVFTLLLVPLVLLATVVYALPFEALWSLGDVLSRIAAQVAIGSHRVLSPVADALPAFVGSFSAVTIVLIVVLVWASLRPWHWRLRALCVLGVFMAVQLNPQAPGPGELTIQIEAADREPRVLLRTLGHALVMGTGASFGSDGGAMAQWLDALPHGVEINFLVLHNGYREQLAAASALWRRHPAAKVSAGVTGRLLPPEVEACLDQSWRWNGIDFSLRSDQNAKGCELNIWQSGRVLRLNTRASYAAAPIRLKRDARGHWQPVGRIQGLFRWHWGIWNSRADVIG